MNGFVPALIAALIAEIGPRAALYADARGRPVVLGTIALAVVAATLGGLFVAPMLNGAADTFLIALALLFAALGQVQRVGSATGPLAILISFWRGGVPLIAFAFAARFGPVAAASGVLAGMAAAAVLTLGARDGGIPLQPVRWAAAGLLVIAAGWLVIIALRLV